MTPVRRSIAHPREGTLHDSDVPLGGDEGEPQWELAGGQVDRLRVSLRVTGEDLDPDQVSILLGVRPTFAARRGDMRSTRGAAVRQHIGVWAFEMGTSSEWTLQDFIGALLDRIPAPLAAWRRLREEYEVDLFCGLFVEEWNPGTGLSRGIPERIPARRFSLSLDIYSGGIRGRS